MFNMGSAPSLADIAACCSPHLPNMAYIHI